MSRIFYFDNAATSWPKPENVYTAAEKYLKNICGNPGRSGNTFSLEADRLMYTAREQLAHFLSVSNPSAVVFTLNATDALNIAIKGILKFGDHVIFTAMEHNSVLRPLGRLRSEGYISTTMVPCDNEGNPDLKFLEDSFCENTKLVICNHASNVFGTKLPVKTITEISHRKGAFVLIDAAQTGGILPVYPEDIDADFIAFAGHKGLLGPPGTGVLYVKETINLQPLREGGTGSHSEHDLQPEIMPERLEAGTMNGPGLAGLIEGIKFINETGLENIRKHELSLLMYLKEGLAKINGVSLHGPSDTENSAAVLSFTMEGLDSGEIGDLLESSFGIICRTGLHCAPLAHKALGTFPEGTVRLSPGYFTTKQDIDHVVDAISQIASLKK